jgi:hypothetical protein
MMMLVSMMSKAMEIMTHIMAVLLLLLLLHLLLLLLLLLLMVMVIKTTMWLSVMMVMMMVMVMASGVWEGLEELMMTERSKYVWLLVVMTRSSLLESKDVVTMSILLALVVVGIEVVLWMMVMHWRYYYHYHYWKCCLVMVMHRGELDSTCCATLADTTSVCRR